MTEDVLFELAEDDVALLTLNRPDRLNAWTPRCRRGTSTCSTSVQRARTSARSSSPAPVAASARARTCRISTPCRAARSSAPRSESDTRPVAYTLSIPKPIIAAINGPCAGIGLVLAVMCDLRIAAAGAKITTAFARRGLVAEHGISWMLPRLVGHARALDLLLSARVVLGAEAAELGLVNRAVQDGTAVEVALTYARELARECSPASMASIKRQVYADDDRTLPETVADANRLMLESFTAPDFAEGVQSFIERRSPNFQPVSTALDPLAR